MDVKECALNGGHQFKELSEWHTPTTPDGVPMLDGEYRQVKCKRCNEEFTEGRAAPPEVSEQVAEREKSI